MGEGPACFWSSMHCSHCHTKSLQTSPLNGMPPQPQPSAFSSDLCTILLRRVLLGSESPSKPIIHFWYAAVLTASVPFPTKAGKIEQRLVVHTHPERATRVVQQSCLSSVLCRKQKAQAAACLLVSLGVDWFWSGVLSDGLEKAGVHLCASLSASHVLPSAWPFCYSLLATFVSPCVMDRWMNE